MPNSPSRRMLLRVLAALGLAVPWAGRAQTPVAEHPRLRWYRKAEEMRDLAQSWGDQNYGAVVVFGGRVIGFGPSRVVKEGNPDAHAERVAIGDAQRTMGSGDLAGAVMYSTSRPCALCERAAARAKVSRMYFGRALADAGAPHSR